MPAPSYHQPSKTAALTSTAIRLSLPYSSSGGPQRPFVCRSHFCLPRSARLELLRQDVTNLGLNELTRLLLAEESSGAPCLDGVPLKDKLDPTDYPANALTGKDSYAEILIKDCVSRDLWRDLCAERKGI